MNELYLQLGRTIARQCPTGFAEAKLQAAFDEDALTLDIVATMQDGMQYSPGLGEAARDALGSALGAVRRAMAQEDGRRWQSCTVTLVTGGGFSIDVDYGPERRDGLQIVTG